MFWSASVGLVTTALSAGISRHVAGYLLSLFRAGRIWPRRDSAMASGFSCAAALAGRRPFERETDMRIFVLTGAGVSAESGLGTVRDAAGTGLWAKFDPSRLATPEAFAADPGTVQAFYDARRRDLIAAEPNVAHASLARLERELAGRGGQLTLVTQNIDDLHERAGSASVIHMHGELLKARCTRCGAVRAQRGDIGAGASCAACGRAGTLRPHVVWFGEMPLEMERIEDALLSADLFVAAGTSGSVHPAAGYVSLAREADIRTCEINLEPSDNAFLFDERRYGPVSIVVPAFVDELLRRV
jgi:NAD-dependent deacetylase